MKIRVAILDEDKMYLNRITTVFMNKYMDKLEVYSFSNIEIALSSLEEKKIDILIANENFEIDFSKIPKRCGLVYFVENSSVEEIKGIKAICKFQKVELIYKQILGIFADISINMSGVKFGENSTNIITFCGASGGVGSSSIAASYARKMAKENKKVLFLELEQFGSSSYFFEGEGMLTFRDILYSIKSKKANLPLKLESAVKRDQSGVYFYESSDVAMDIAEMKVGDFKTLIQTLRTTAEYDLIVLDVDFSMSDLFIEIIRTASIIVLTGDGSEISNVKLMRIYETIKIIEQKNDIKILQKMKLIYNKFSNKTGNILEDIEISNIGGVPKFEHATTKQILMQLECRDKLLEKINE